MFSILLPSDFSKESENAISFASTITQGMTDIKLILFHSIYIHGITPGMLKEIEDLLIKEANEELKKIKDELHKTYKGNIKPEHKIVFGNPAINILDFAKENKIDLILMSRHTTGSFEKVVIGSNTIEIIKHSSCPVLVVPEKTQTSQINTITYASNLENINEELLEIIPFVKLFNAKLNIIHIYPEAINGALFDIEKITDDTVKSVGYDKINFYFSMNNDIKNGIDTFIKENKTDLMILFTKHRDFWEELYNKSLTAEIALNENIPMLAIPKNNENPIYDYDKKETFQVGVL